MPPYWLTPCLPPCWLTPCLPPYWLTPRVCPLVGSPHLAALLLAHPLSVPCRYVIGPTIHGRVNDR